MNMQHPEISAGIIGTGFIGPVHIEALRRINIPVVAVCGSENAHALAKKWDIKEVYTNYDALALIQSPNVDVVHITSPNKYHFEASMAAIEAGKHCVCEKPLAMTSAETAQIVERVELTSLVFAVNYNYRFFPAMLEIRARIANNELGDIIHLNGSYLQDWLLYDTDFNWRVLPEEGGDLRAVGDIGTHWMDLASFITNARINSVFADLGRLHETRFRPKGSVETFTDGSKKHEDLESFTSETEDFASVLMNFENGARGNLSVSQVAAGRKNCLRIEVYGSRMSAFWNSEEPDYLHFGCRGESNRTFLRDPAGVKPSVAPYTDYPAGHAEGYPDSFKMLYRNIYNVIKGASSDTALFAKARDGHQEILICEAILESNRRRIWVEVGI